MKLFITLTLALVLSLPSYSHNVGDDAPDFTLNTLGGSSVTLSELQGKVVFIFVFGFNCSSCIGAGPAIQSQLINTYKDNPNFVALAIDKWNGNKSGVQNFKDASKLEIAMLMQGASVSTQLETERDRILVIDHNGKFAFVGKQNAVNDISAAKSAISSVLQNVSTSIDNVKQNSEISIVPNPVNLNALFTYTLSESNTVSLAIYDITGKKVQQIFAGSALAGEHIFEFNRQYLPDGVYFYQLQIGNKKETGKLILQ